MRPPDNDEPVLPGQTSDDTDTGWGESPKNGSEYDDDTERLTAERPPHYDDRDRD